MNAMVGQQDRLIIFDTTLRDGEQSPGASMNLAEKLQVAHALKDLGVDVIEAGFPIASPGDFEAVQAVARQVEGPVICGLARCNADDIDRAWAALCDVFAAAVEEGARTVNVPDTVGYATPPEYAELIRAVREASSGENSTSAQ